MDIGIGQMRLVIRDGFLMYAEDGCPEMEMCVGIGSTYWGIEFRTHGDAKTEIRCEQRSYAIALACHVNPVNYWYCR